MAKNATPKQLNFIDCIVAGKMQPAEAYMQCYKVNKSTKPATVKRNALKLMCDATVAPLISKGRAAAAEKASYKAVDYLFQLEECRAAALAGGDFATAHRATISKGRACGYEISAQQARAAGQQAAVTVTSWREYNSPAEYAEAAAESTTKAFEKSFNENF
jgi:hypothetical protein